MINTTKVVFSGLLFLFFFGAKNTYAVDSLKVLFIGNSYTYLSNMPQIIKDMAAAGGKHLEYSTSTQGGSTLQQHCNNPTTLALLQQGGWDYVVLQEQSQIPSFPENQVESEFYPYAKELDSLVHVYTPCAKTVFFITWGRKNGDQQNCPVFPPVCTYEGMDSLLTLRYTAIADTTHAYLCPVGPLWHAIRDSLPNIELYLADESHPSIAGSFAAACSFYAILFGANVQNNSYVSGLPVQEAQAIKAMTQKIVADSLAYWYRFHPPVSAAFTIDSSAGAGTVHFTNQSTGAGHYFWDFGDGQTSHSENPTHVFEPGQYIVCLTASDSCEADQYCDTLQVGNTGINTSAAARRIDIFPNPVTEKLHIQNISSGVKYTIHDVLGRVLKIGHIPNGKVIKMDELAPGVYFLTLDISTSHLEQAVFKFQKQ